MIRDTLRMFEAYLFLVKTLNLVIELMRTDLMFKSLVDKKERKSKINLVSYKFRSISSIMKTRNGYYCMLNRYPINEALF